MLVTAGRSPNPTSLCCLFPVCDPVFLSVPEVGRLFISVDSASLSEPLSLASKDISFVFTCSTSVVSSLGWTHPRH